MVDAGGDRYCRGMENLISILVGGGIGFGVLYLVVRAAVASAIRATADVLRGEAKPTE